MAHTFVPRLATMQSIPPSVTAQAWAILDGSNGQILYGKQETLHLQKASLTKIMTAHLVLNLALEDPEVAHSSSFFSY